MEGINFTKVGVVEAVNDINGASYAYNDPENITTLAWYRLKLLSYSGGRFKYSEVIQLYNKKARIKVSAVNPFKTNLKIDIFLPENGNVEFNLFDLFGKNVTRKIVHLSKGNSKAILDDVSHLPAGIYILRTSFNNTFLQNKLFKAN